MARFGGRLLEDRATEPVDTPLVPGHPVEAGADVVGEADNVSTGPTTTPTLRDVSGKSSRRRSSRPPSTSGTPSTFSRMGANCIACASRVHRERLDRALATMDTPGILSIQS
jgi:hypothetical protein